MFRQLRRNRNGSFTVEAAILMPIVILTIVALIYMCLLLYQQVCIQTVAEKAVQRGAAVWSSNHKDMYISKISKNDMENCDPYWRYLESGDQKQKKVDKIKDYIKLQINRYNVLNSSTPSVITLEDDTDYLIYKKLKVTITQNYRLPIGRMLTSFGLKADFPVTVHTEAVVNEPTEFIRNTDFIIDTGKEIDRKIFKDKVGNFGDKMKEDFGKLMGKLKDFIK